MDCKRICICGGGSLGHVTAGYLANKKNISVNIHTRKPQSWSNELRIYTPEGESFVSNIDTVSSDYSLVVSNADIILLCLPGYAIKEEIENIAPYLKPGAFVGSVFSSTGFFFEAINILPNNIPLWGFQRVPFIARTKEYGKSAHLLGYKSEHSIAVERCENKDEFRSIIESLFDAPTQLLNNFYEASFTNSNPILHPARLYTLFKDWNENVYYRHQFLFYEEWNNAASQILISLDNELFSILKELPVSKDFLRPILKHYESYDAESLTKKISSIASFKGIKTPMIESKEGWQPDFGSRYFQEDFEYGLRYIYETAHKLSIPVPTIDMVYNWGKYVVKKHQQ